MLSVAQRELDRRAVAALLAKRRRQLRALEASRRRIPPNATWWEITKARKLTEAIVWLRCQLQIGAKLTHPKMRLPRE